MISKTEMLMTANHLESRGDDAYRDRVSVRMTPQEVHALADDIKAFVRESDRPTCHLVEDEDGYTACSECGCTALCMRDAVFCPSCGARVIHKEGDDGNR